MAYEYFESADMIYYNMRQFVKWISYSAYVILYK